ncbi:MAG: helix-turn-helix domain-containing protein [Octadecabacter sp.]|nr:helix-turn-helix domain-containing protein [Octadecabacter sp.]
MHHDRPNTTFLMNSRPVSVADRNLQTYLFVTQDSTVQFVADACGDVLRSANGFLEHNRFSWQCVNGLSGLKTVGKTVLSNSVLVLIGGVEKAWPFTDAELRVLKPAFRSARHVCVIGAGIFPPLSAGLLDGRRISVHPNFRIAASEIAIDADISCDAITHSSGLSSATGYVAASITISELVGKQAGAVTKQALDDHLGLNRPTQPADTQERLRLLRKSRGHPVIAAALEVISDNLEDPLPIRQLAEAISVSTRQLERVCSTTLEMSPKQLYRELQLRRAHTLLTQTNLSITEVSVASGFNSNCVLSKWYREEYGELPSQTRKYAWYGCSA